MLVTKIIDTYPYAKIQTNIHKETWWLAVGSRTSVSSYLGLTGWMYMHPRVVVHSGTGT